MPEVWMALDPRDGLTEPHAIHSSDAKRWFGYSP